MVDLHVGRFYRVNGRILFCHRYTWHANKPGEEAILTHRVIGENQEPYRTVAEIAGIPFPDKVEVHCSADARIEEVSREEAFQEWAKMKRAWERSEQSRKQAEVLLRQALSTAEQDGYAHSPLYVKIDAFLHPIDDL